VEDRVALEGYGGMAENAAELVRARVNVIFAYGSTAVAAAARATEEIPIVMVIGVDPVEMGLAASLSHPGGNITGVTNIVFELTAKRLQLLHEVVPKMSRVGALIATGSRAATTNRREIEAAAHALNLQLHVAEVRNPVDIEPAFSNMARSRVDGVYISPSTMMAASKAQVVALAARHRLPAMYADRRFVDAGGLMQYGSNVYKAFTLAATYVDRILKGARPSDLPIEQMSKFEFIINLKTVKALGIAIPQSILLRADELVQ
jgi:putative ABC transport system substrate-binding protein